VINYDRLTVDFVDNTYDQDFAINMFVDRAVYESMLVAIEDDVNFFNGNLLAIIRTSVVLRDEDGNPILDDQGEKILQEVRVPVYSFVNEAEFLSTNPSKSLRVQTLYGIGYIGLVDQPYENDNMVAVVYDPNTNEPIIKYFEQR